MCLGHLPFRKLKLIPNIYLPNDFHEVCDACHKAKQSRLPFPINNKRSIECFALTHVDIWGPYSISSLSGACFFLTIVDDHSRCTWVYLMKNK